MRGALVSLLLGACVATTQVIAVAEPQARELAIDGAPQSARPGQAIHLRTVGGTGPVRVFYFQQASDNESGATLDTSTGLYTAGARVGATDWVSVRDMGGHVAFWIVKIVTPLHIVTLPGVVAPRGRLRLETDAAEPSFVSWAIVENRSAASITNGAYVAGANGDVEDVVEASFRSERAKVRIKIGPPLRLDDAISSIAPGATRRMQARGGSNSGWRWSIVRNASGGAIHAETGLYTAGGKRGVWDMIEVRDSLGNSAAGIVNVGTAGRASK